MSNLQRGRGTPFAIKGDLLEVLDLSGRTYIKANGKGMMLQNSPLSHAWRLYEKPVLNGGINYLTSDEDVIGINQTPQDMAASRSAGTAYQNTTGKPIQWLVHGSSGASAQVSSDGMTWVTVAILGATGAFKTFETSASPIIPANHFYKTTGNFTVWTELR